MVERNPLCLVRKVLGPQAPAKGRELLGRTAVRAGRRPRRLLGLQLGVDLLEGRLSTLLHAARRDDALHLATAVDLGIVGVVLRADANPTVRRFTQKLLERPDRGRQARERCSPEVHRGGSGRVQSVARSGGRKGLDGARRAGVFLRGPSTSVLGVKGAPEWQTHIAFKLVEQRNVVVRKTLHEHAADRRLVFRKTTAEDLCSVCRADDGGIVCGRLTIESAQSRVLPKIKDTDLRR